MQDQQQGKRTAGSSTPAKPAEPAGRDLAAASASPGRPVDMVDGLSAGLGHVERTQAAAEGLVADLESTPGAMAPEQAEDTQAAGAELVAAPSIDELDVVRHSSETIDDLIDASSCMHVSMCWHRITWWSRMVVHKISA